VRVVEIDLPGANLARNLERCRSTVGPISLGLSTMVQSAAIAGAALLTLARVTTALFRWPGARIPSRIQWVHGIDPSRRTRGAERQFDRREPLADATR